MSEDDYTVGYRRPSKHTQFKPGQSGNPKGRPKRTKGFAEFVNEYLFRTVAVQENGKRRKKTLGEINAQDFVHKAAKGDSKARRDLFNFVNRYPKVAKPLPEIPWITKDMSPQEAAEAYRKTLTSIPGLLEPDAAGEFDL